MALRTKRWNDPALAADGYRLLVCRIRPRGVAKATEPWDAWWPELGPSRPLLDAFHGKTAAPIDFAREYAPRYLEEMRGAAQTWRIRSLAQRVAGGETITLLCSSACVDPDRCHRTLLKRLVEQAAAPSAVSRPRR
ncbi:MAG TPA: DUF488 family protein [Polyangia bacterium]|jgi:uncharacterized protein YeaO (DUF488 family)|nr:DUF488 family protein [Polyangia bacterium]